MRIVLLSKTDRFSRAAQDHANAAFGAALETAEGRVGDPFPACLDSPGDVLISFLSPWIVKAEQLDRFGTSINFHPASTDYPGSGCYNFALYDDAPEYGATCHHMLPKVDTGRVVLERRFPVSPKDTVETLKLVTMDTMLGMFREIVDLVAAGDLLPAAAAHWTRKPYTFREMEALKVLLPDMTQAEVARRLRATIYPGYPGPVMQMPCGGRVAYPVPQRPALA